LLLSGQGTTDYDERMHQLWAPWRMAYIASSQRPTGCVFCVCVKRHEPRDASSLVLHRGRHAFVIMNRFPYNSGHLMVAPYAHVKALESLQPDVILDLLGLTTLSLSALQAEIRPEGFNIGLNLGRVSGAGIEDHLHLHIVPRWNGDTNFMPLFAETRVIPEHLHATYRKLRHRFAQLAKATARRRVAVSDRPSPVATQRAPSRTLRARRRSPRRLRAKR
jgi:ATP adenylyltransferase